MHIETLRKHIGNVVTLDLVNGKDFTTRITEVDAGTLQVKCSKPRMFVPITGPEGMQVHMLEYGYPLYRCDDAVLIDSAHVIMVLTPSPDQIDKYTRETGSLVKATTLQGLDLSGLTK